MILAVHSIVGGATAIALRQNPIAAFFAAFLSHFILDAIPHYDYKISSKEKTYENGVLKSKIVFGRKFARDLLITGFDCLSGTLTIMLTALYFYQGSALIAFIGAIGGVLPDFLQLIYYIIPKSPIRYIQWLHGEMHTKIKLSKRPILGFSIQALIAATVIILIVVIR